MIGKETIGHLELTLKTIKQNSLQFCGVFLLAVGQLPSIGEGNLFFYGLDRPKFLANQNNDTDFTYKYLFFFTTYILSNMIVFRIME